MGTHKIYSGIQGIRDNISGSLYGDCHELLAGGGGIYILYTATSRKVVGKNVQATIPKGSMGYDQYIVPYTVPVEP